MDTDEARAAAAAELDHLQQTLWSRVDDADADLTDTTKAATAIRQIIADRRQLLGLDTRHPRAEPRHLIQPGLNLPAAT